MGCQRRNILVMPSLARSVRVLPALGVLALAAPADAQTTPHRAHSFDASDVTGVSQLRPDVAIDDEGDFVVVWQAIDGASLTVNARRFDVRARPRGAEFRVHAATTNAQRVPAVAADPRGRFVVAWQEDDADRSASAILARRFDAQGVPRGPAFVVNAHTTGGQTLPSVAVDRAGRTIVVWESLSQDGSQLGVIARRFDAAGDPIGGDFVIPANTMGDQDAPAVAAAADGSFVVAWRGETGLPAGGDAVFARRFDSGGSPMGGDVRVDTAGTNARGPTVASAADGSFFVAWRQGQHVLRRSFAADGTPLSAPIAVAFFPTQGPFVAPAVAADATGGFVVSWEVSGGSDPGYGLLAQRFERNGTAREAGFVVASVTTGNQRAPAIAAEPSGNFLLAWTSDHVTTDEVVGQTFGGMFPVRPLYVDLLGTPTSDGNGMFEPNETVEVCPSWRNESWWSSTGSFRTLFTALDGPPVVGGGYTFTTSFLAYPPIHGVPGEQVTSHGCASVGVTASSRPLLHWDVVVTEEVQNAGQGQRKRWPLHIAESFPDVPRANPFYRFVETLLHHGITTGCGAAAYCPTAAMTRAQMAVFVIVAREGSAYLPPACGATPAFADVPPSDPFCRWIEELARRGVVGGCGGGNYCPTFAVSREQMPVFVLRALDPALSPPACASDPYADVPASSPFCRWIRELTVRGVVAGCGNGLYCPVDPVTREQMGVFIGATFDLVPYGP